MPSSTLFELESSDTYKRFMDGEFDEPDEVVVSSPLVRGCEVPFLEDVDCANVVYRWYKLVIDGDRLEVVECGTTQTVYDRAEFIDCDYFDTTTLFGSNYDDHLVDWALREGLSPGQPFLVEVPPPYTSRSYEGEYDEDWSFEVVRRAPVKPTSAAKAWEAALARMKRAKALNAKFHADFQARALRSYKTWELQEHMYRSGPSSFYDWREDDTVTVSLVSRLEKSHTSLGSATAKFGGHITLDAAREEAFFKLVAAFKARYPEGNINALRMLGSDKYKTRRTLWEHLDEEPLPLREYDAEDHAERGPVDEPVRQ